MNADRPFYCRTEPTDIAEGDLVWDLSSTFAPDDAGLSSILALQYGPSVPFGLAARFNHVQLAGDATAHLVFGTEPTSVLGAFPTMRLVAVHDGVSHDVPMQWSPVRAPNAL